MGKSFRPVPFVWIDYCKKCGKEKTKCKCTIVVEEHKPTNLKTLTE
jgi:DTW domain-containing protein YfiP